MSLFLRLLGEEDKGAALEAAVRSVAAGQRDARVFEVDPESFGQVPGAPFAYWVSEPLRQLFPNLEPFDANGREAKGGMKTQQDDRFLRASWEVAADCLLQKTWVPLCKGGSYSPFYTDVHLLADWEDNGKRARAAYEVKVANASWGGFGRNESFYFRAGLTWPGRTQSPLALRAMPAGCIFGHKGPAAFVARDEPQSLLALLALTNSAAFRRLIELQMAFGSYEVGVVQRTPVPSMPLTETTQLAVLARRAWSLKRSLDTATLPSHAFVLPSLLQVAGPDLASRSAAWSGMVSDTDRRLIDIQSEIDDRCFDLYGFTAADRAAALGTEAVADATTIQADADDATGTEDPEEDDSASSASLRCNNPQALAAELFDWLVGVAFGRFDLRLATGERAPPPEPEPFDPLPVCSPGMLTGPDGLPPAAPPPGYPLDFPADGILVDDAGIDGNAPVETDLPRRLRQVIQHLWGEEAPAVEAELCQLLGVRTPRDWLRRPAGFFADHLGRWSKSRRKAPLCWPLASESGGYTLWLYYPRLTDQTLYRCVNEYLDPKLREIAGDLERLRGKSQPDAQPDSRSRRRSDDLVALQREVLGLREELLRVANLPYKPDQNDGVVITAAPLWQLFRHKPWQKELKRCWDALAAGDYDWAHLSLSLWPGRVRDRCRADKSIAIAHGLEDLYES